MQTDLISELHEYLRQALAPLDSRLAALERAAANIPEKGEKGESGIGLAGALINRSGELVVTLSNGEAVNLGSVEGRDGFTLEDFAAAYDGERGLVLSFEGGGLRREFRLHLPVVIHRGFWRDGSSAKAGDAWTRDGSLWIAARDTTKKPCYENREDWTLAARKGRDAEPVAAHPIERRTLTLHKGTSADGKP